MLRSISIEGLRGIREGRLENLTPLVVLVGPNGSGKSTILEALFMGCSNLPSQAVGQVGSSRRFIWHGARWLIRDTGPGATARIEMTAADNRTQTTVLSRRSDLGDNDLNLAAKGGLHAPHDLIEIHVSTGGAELDSKVVFGANNRFAAVLEIVPHLLSDDIRFPDFDSSNTSLHDAYSAATTQGRGDLVQSFLREALPGLQRLEILTDSGVPALHLCYQTHTVPVGAGGDGIIALLWASLHLSAQQGGSILLEEPEAHQHPGAIHQTGRAIIMAVRRGVQVVLATHSLELIDALYAELSETELSLLSVYRTKLTEDGVLRTSRLDGPIIAQARTDIGEDLR